MELSTELHFVEHSGIFQCSNISMFVIIRDYSQIKLIRECSQIMLIIFCAWPNPPPAKNRTLVWIWTKSWFGPILVWKIDWSFILTTMIFGAANYTFLESLGPGQYNKTIFKMFYNCFKYFCTIVNIEMLYRVILYVTYS